MQVTQTIANTEQAPVNQGQNQPKRALQTGFYDVLTHMALSHKRTRESRQA